MIYNIYGLILTPYLFKYILIYRINLFTKDIYLNIIIIIII